jgi:hypothetical protein
VRRSAPVQDCALKWRGSGATFEIVPVVPSQETMDVVAPYLDDVHAAEQHSLGDVHASAVASRDGAEEEDRPFERHGH